VDGGSVGGCCDNMVDGGGVVGVDWIMVIIGRCKSSVRIVW
jgi:hypothetical protein